MFWRLWFVALALTLVPACTVDTTPSSGDPIDMGTQEVGSRSDLGGSGGTAGEGGTGGQGAAGGQAGAGGQGAVGGQAGAGGEGAAGGQGATGGEGATGGQGGTGGEGGIGGQGGTGGGIGGQGGEGGAGGGQAVVPEGCIDVDPLPDAVAGLAFGPSARMTRLSVPANNADSLAAGCDVVGLNNGTGLSGWLNLAGIDPQALVTEAEDGAIALIWLLQLENWRAGQRPHEAADVRLKSYYGRQDRRAIQIQRASLIREDPTGGARWSFEATLDNCELSTQDADLLDANGNVNGLFELPIGSDVVPTQVSLVRPSFQGRVETSPEGFQIRNGVLTGYWMVDAIVAMVADLQMFCEGPNAPQSCANIDILLQGEPQTITNQLFLPLLRGSDARVTPEGVEQDCGVNCNAVSVCLQFQAESIQIEGVAPIAAGAGE